MGTTLDEYKLNWTNDGQWSNELGHRNLNSNQFSNISRSCNLNLGNVQVYIYLKYFLFHGIMNLPPPIPWLSADCLKCFRLFHVQFDGNWAINQFWIDSLNSRILYVQPTSITERCFHNSVVFPAINLSMTCPHRIIVWLLAASAESTVNAYLLLHEPHHHSFIAPINYAATSTFYCCAEAHSCGTLNG